MGAVGKEKGRKREGKEKGREGKGKEKGTQLFLGSGQ